jgi:hypothetical protein
MSDPVVALPKVCYEYREKNPITKTYIRLQFGVNTLLGVVSIESGGLFPELESAMSKAGRAVIIFFILFSVTKLLSGIMCWEMG